MPLKIDSFYDSTGVLLVKDGYGSYYVYDENKGWGRGDIAKGFKDGEWVGHVKKPNLDYKEIYEKGKLLSGTSIDSAGVHYTYNTVKVNPTPRPDINYFLSYVRENLSYPRAA